MNGPTPGATHPAGFWIRLLAFAIDLLIIVVAQLGLQVIGAARFGVDGALGPVGFFTFVFAVAYPTVLHTIAGQTLGKLVTGVRVVAMDGGPLPLGAAFLRAIAFWAALLLTLGIGHVMGGLRKDKRALHDLVAGSRAERLPPAMSTRRAPLSRTAPPPVAASPLVPPNLFQAPPAEPEPRSTG